MREIKFRLIWHGRIVGYEFHYLGELPKGATIVSENGEHSGIYHKRIGSEFYKNILDDPNNSIPHDFKEMFTGLLDKNGVEIFKGDVVKLFMVRKGVMSVYWESCEVFFRNGHWNAGYPEGQGKALWEWTRDPKDTYAVEVIGNKWENPA